MSKSKTFLKFASFILLTFNPLDSVCYAETQCESYDENVDVDMQPVQRRRRCCIPRYRFDPNDPTEPLESQTAWPSWNEEFSDRLFTPSGGPW